MEHKKDTKPIISIKSLEKTYNDESGETRALRGVSFDIMPGEFVAIMGPSGSGKSTLLHMLGFLDKTYNDESGETRALRGVSFDIMPGEFVAIMGPSGSGKSTLLHMLGLLDKFTGGEYFLKGRKVENFSDDEVAHMRNKRMGFIFQAFNLLPKASVLDNVKLPLAYSDVPEDEWFDLAKKAD